MRGEERFVELITSHVNTDFDGFASMIAARKLYPGAEIILSGQVQPNVRNYMSLYRDVWFPVRFSGLPSTKVHRLIVVDTAKPARLGKIRPLVEDGEVEEVHLFDHHPPAPDDLSATYRVVEPLGATTTILVEILRSRRIPIDHLEATLFCLGIYEDTGCLTFSSTTVRDVEAVAHLLRCGADLGIVSSYLHWSLSPEQRSLLKKLLDTGQVIDVQGLQVFLAKASVPHYVRGLDLIAHRVTEIVNSDAIFLLVQMGTRIYLTSRSRTETIRVNEVLRNWQGGGHYRAAAAVVKNGDLEEVEEKLLEILRKQVKSGPVAREIMSTPVKTVSPDTTLKEAGQIMLRYGHSGLPVVENEVLVGIISRRDIDKARQHSLTHAPVKGYMSRNVVTVTPEASLAEIQKLLVKYDIGRLPVVDACGHLVGIVSRSDVLNVLHSGKYPHPYHHLYVSGDATDQVILGKNWDISGLLERRLPGFLLEVLHKVGVAAEKASTTVYLVGDFVRDLLRGQPGKELELIVEGDRGFLEDLGELFSQPVGEGLLFLSLSDGYVSKIRIASSEFSEYPSRRNQERVALRDELYKRDFTVDTLAVHLNASCFGRLLDFFGGQGDLLKGLVRVLHNFSFVEDPLRILKAIRYEQVLGYRLEKQTKILLENAIKEKLLLGVSREHLMDELEICFQKGKFKEIWKRSAELQLDEQIAEIVGRERLTELLQKAEVLEREDCSA
ncbi:MAG TPA: hypothetical protein DCE07_02595 [Peptococcaceae bacterium]|nr:hypothetical protein [Peptococcaceae bacterium]